MLRPSTRTHSFGRFALEWWGRPGDRDAITQAIRAALHARDRV